MKTTKQFSFEILLNRAPLSQEIEPVYRALSDVRNSGRADVILKSTQLQLQILINLIKSRDSLKIKTLFYMIKSMLIHWGERTVCAITHLRILKVTNENEKQSRIVCGQEV